MITAMRANNLRFGIKEDILSFLLGWFAHKILDELYNYIKTKVPNGSPKRIFRAIIDVVISIAFIAATLHILIIIATVIRLRVTGRIIIASKIMFQGRPITVYKFICPGDKVGNFIKITSLHMLPSMFNFLKGDMSISTEIPNAIRFFGRQIRSR